MRIKAFSHIEGATIAAGAEIGPYARLRPGAEIGEGAKVGNFVEIKKAKLGKGAKANHLTYLGDADVGAGANIGAGTITCNYDGYFKYRTEIGEGAFIGSNSALVAPVSIGKGALVGAGLGDHARRARGRGRARPRRADRQSPAAPSASAKRHDRAKEETKSKCAGSLELSARRMSRSGCSTG